MSRAIATTRLAGALLLGLCVGCGSSGGPEDETGPRLVLGTGREAFEPLESGGTVLLIKGIQGGFHVWTSFFAYGFDTDIMQMTLSTRWGGREESVLDMHGSVGVKPSSDAGGVPVLEMLGWPALVFDPPCANGQEIDIGVTVTDPQGRSASDARRWILNVPEEDRSADCAL
jgi:hypothetical protein